MGYTRYPVMGFSLYKSSIKNRIGGGVFKIDIGFVKTAKLCENIQYCFDFFGKLFNSSVFSLQNSRDIFSGSGTGQNSRRECKEGRSSHSLTKLSICELISHIH